MPKFSVFDIEANGFNPDRIHCLAMEQGEAPKATTSYKAMRSYLSRQEYLVGHNIIRYDVPVLEDLLEVEVGCTLIDTLALSWYLFSNRVRHGLADWGEEFGVPKPKVDDWEGLSPEEYMHRCKEDVRINKLLWDKCWSYLLALYGSEEEALKLCAYLTFKMQCVNDQERLGWQLDVEGCEKLLKKLSEERSVKVEALVEVMPKVPEKAIRKPPAKPYKQDGTLSASGLKWKALTEENDLPFTYSSPIEVVVDWVEGNPSSSSQVKDWLYSFGWDPETFDYKRNKKTGDVRTIPQVRADYGEGKELCRSVKKLFKKNPDFELLEGLSILDHRIPMLEGFLKNVNEEGRVRASIGGLTNTLRLKHRILANLPSIEKPYGKEIRGLLTCGEGQILCGSDMSSLEDRTKQHYMWPYDPDYVTEMMTPDFDPHVDLCVVGKLLTPEQGRSHKLGEADYGKIRKKGKAANYACVYGASGATVARSAGIPKKEGENLVKAYWERNWSVKAIAEDCTVKKIGSQMWQLNPVSGLWYSLRQDKDRFSTLNQGTGVYCFDMWVKGCKERGVPIVGQFHDEIIALLSERHADKCKKVLKEAVGEVNQLLNLNRELDVDVQFGKNYSEIH